MSEIKDSQNIVKIIDEIYDRAWRAVLPKEEVEEYDSLCDDDDSAIRILVQAHRTWQSSSKKELELDAKALVAHLQDRLEREFKIYTAMLKQWEAKVNAKDDKDDDSELNYMEASVMQDFVYKLEIILFIQKELKALRL